MGLYVQYRAAFVSLTLAIAFIGTYSAVAALEQFRIAVSSGNSLARHKLLWLVSFCLGGVCIWGQFYMTTASYRLIGPSGEMLLKMYDTVLCVTSVPVAIVWTHIGLLIASTDPYFTRSKKEILEVYWAGRHDASRMPANSYVVYVHRPARIIIGGLFLAAALIIMRHMGLSSIYITGSLDISPGITVLYAILAAVGSVLGFWIYFRVLSINPSWDILRTACALHGVLLFAGLEYVGVLGVTFHYDPDASMPSEEDGVAIKSIDLFAGSIIAAVMVAFLVLVFVLADLRTWLQKTNSQLRHADRALLSLLHRPAAERNLNTHQYSGDVGGPGTGVSGGAHAKSPQQQRLFTQPPRHSQAPLEVVNYSRQFLKSVAQRTSTQSEIFTYQHRLFYDIDPERFGVPDRVMIRRGSGAQEISREVSRLSGAAEHPTQILDTLGCSASERAHGNADKGVGVDVGVQMIASGVRLKPQPSFALTDRDLEVSTTLRRVFVETAEEEDDV